MVKTLIFKVEIEGLEDKIWRTIEITDSKTIADLAYTILAIFNSLAYHLYAIKHGKDKYDCMVCADEHLSGETFIDATKTTLKNIDFSHNAKMNMEYDFGSPTTFIITYLKTTDIENDTYYPRIIEGQGNGMLDDLPAGELSKIVKNTDELGYSKHLYSPGYEKDDIYDYRKYDIEYDNQNVKDTFNKIKNGYEIKKNEIH